MIARFTIGFNFRAPSPAPNAQLILRSDIAKIVVDTNEEGFFYADKDITKDWSIGGYLYQIQTEDGIIESGSIELLPNYALSEVGVSVKSRAQQMVDAIEAVIEGRANQSTKEITVGDKKLAYMDLDELLKYLNYFKGKVAQEEGKSSVNDEKKILFQWRGF